MSQPNYFEVLNLPVKLKIDKNDLKKNYFNLLKENSNDPVLDPDQKVQSDNKGQIQLLEKAYETLSDRLTRIYHLLELQGIEVANTNKAPAKMSDLAEKVEPLLQIDALQEAHINELKELHKEVLAEFSTISIELAQLEDAWDEQGREVLLRKLKRKSVAFDFIRTLEQGIREKIN